MVNQSVTDYLLEKLEREGVATASVKDGQVFLFSLAQLEKLVEAARETGRATVFVRRQVQE